MCWSYFKSWNSVDPIPHSKIPKLVDHISHQTKEWLIIGSLSYYSYYYNAFVSLLIILKPSTFSYVFELLIILTMILTSILTMSNSWFIIHHIDILLFGGLEKNHFSIYWESYSQLTNSYFQRGRYTTNHIYYSILFPYQGKIYKKTPYLMGKTMVFCRCSLKPSHWYRHIDF